MLPWAWLKGRREQPPLPWRLQLHLTLPLAVEVWWRWRVRPEHAEAPACDQRHRLRPRFVCVQICKLKGQGVYAFTARIPGADLEPSLRPIIFPYIDLNLQVSGCVWGS